MSLFNWNILELDKYCWKDLSFSDLASLKIISVDQFQGLVYSPVGTCLVWLTSACIDRVQPRWRQRCRLSGLSFFSLWQDQPGDGSWAASSICCPYMWWRLFPPRRFSLDTVCLFIGLSDLSVAVTFTEGSLKGRHHGKNKGGIFRSILEFRRSRLKPHLEGRQSFSLKKKKRNLFNCDERLKKYKDVAVLPLLWIWLAEYYFRETTEFKSHFKTHSGLVKLVH